MKDIILLTLYTYLGFNLVFTFLVFFVIFSEKTYYPYRGDRRDFNFFQYYFGVLKKKNKYEIDLVGTLFILPTSICLFIYTLIFQRRRIKWFRYE